MTSLEEEKQAITELIDDFNESWLFQDFEKLATHLHGDVLFVKSKYSKELTGIEACITSYKQFLRVASINRYVAHDVSSCIWGDFANAYYHFEMEYEMGAKVTFQKGVEVLTFKKVNEEWKMIWRSVSNVQVLHTEEVEVGQGPN